MPTTPMRHAEDADRRQPLLLAGQPGGERGDEGHAGDEQPGQRAGQRPLGVGEEEPRPGHLQQR